MSAITEPLKFSTPFAETGLKNTIPATANNATGKAGFDKGFPERTMLPKMNGGIPPSGMDFNGILYDITSAVRYMQAGGKPTYDAEFAAAIGGYPSGAVLIGDDGVSVFQNSVAGNETDPNSGGAGWTRPDLQVMELYRRSYAEAGYNLVDGSFEAGGTLVNVNDVLLQEATGAVWSAGTYPQTVPANTNPFAGGFTDRSGVTYRSVMEGGKFEFFSDGTFFYIRNKTTGSAVLRLANNENASDAHLALLPFEVRRNSHGYILTTATDTGSCDIDFRRFGGIDRGYLQYRGLDDSFVVLGDTTPHDDGIASFDDKIVVPLNSNSPIKFPSTLVDIGQGLRLKKRTTGVNSYLFRVANNTTSIIEEVTGNTLAVLMSNGFLVGGKTFLSSPAAVTAYLGNGAYNYSGNTSLANGASATFLMGKPGTISHGTIHLGCQLAGSSTPRSKFARFQSSISSNTMVDITPVDLPAGVTVTTAMDASGSTLTITNGSGGTLRVGYEINFSVSTS